SRSPGEGEHPPFSTGLAGSPREAPASVPEPVVRPDRRRTAVRRGRSGAPPLPAGAPPGSAPVQQQVDRVDRAAGEPAHHRPVHADELEVVARLVLDEPYRPFRPERADPALDERG